jgi:hypothetical protein
MSINKLVSIRNAIIGANALLGLDHDKDTPTFTLWGIEAEEEIGSKGAMERKRVVLDIHGCAACLPDDAMILECAILGDQGCDCADLFNSTFCGASGSVFINNANVNTYGFLIVDVAGVSGDVPVGIVDYTIQNNKIVFTGNYDGQKVTVQYQGAVLDCDGFMMIGKNHVRAVSAYILWKDYERRKKKTGADMAQMQYWERQWNQLCSHARADDAILTQPERETIALMNSDPYAGRGLSVGMRTTLGFGSNTYGGF